MGRDPRKLVFGFTECVDCDGIVPAGVFECPHCHSASRRVIVPEDAAAGMAAAVKKADEGAVHFREGRLVNAIAAVREAVAMNPWNAKTHGNLGYLLRQSGDIDEAAECLERALLLSPSLVGVHQQLLEVSKQIGKPVDAWKSHEFSGVFEFATTDDARNAVRILPISIFERLKTREVMPGSPAGLRLEGDSLLKAEIWFIVLALRARGSSRQKFALPKTSKEEIERAIGSFVF